MVKLVICSAQAVTDVSRTCVASGDGSCKGGEPEVAADGPLVVGPAVFKKKTCDEIISYAKIHGSKQDIVNDNPVNGLDRVFAAWVIDLSDNQIKWLRNRLDRFVAKARAAGTLWFDVGDLQRLHVASYAASGSAPGRFGWHSDMDSTQGRNRLLSLTLQLSEPGDYEGGALQVGREIVNMQRGTITLFPAWMMHQVTPVSAGSRFSLVGWYGPALGSQISHFNKYALPHYKHMIEYADSQKTRDEKMVYDTLRRVAQVAEPIRHYVDAERAFRRLLKLETNPAYKAFWTGKVGHMLERRGMHSDALIHFQESLRLDPDNADLRKLAEDTRQRLV